MTERRQDILSELLRSVRLRGAVFFFVHGGQTWAAEAPAAKAIAAKAMPGSEHVMEYHVITRGSCWAAIVGEPPVRLHPGDIVVQNGTRHRWINRGDTDAVWAAIVIGAEHTDAPMA